MGTQGRARRTVRAGGRRATSRLIATAVALAALSAGCAHGPVVTRLTYPPSPGAIAPVPVEDASATVVVGSLVDLRPEPRNVVIKVWDGYRNFDVVTPDDVPAWATGALRTELERLGVGVADVGEPHATQVIGGEVTDVRCDATFPSSAGRVTIRAWLEKGDERTLDRTYVGVGRRRVMWKATPEVYERCLADALRDAATRVAADAKTVALGGSPPPANVEPSTREPSRVANAGKVVLALSLLEGMVLGFSEAAARAPSGVGWGLVVLSPLAAGSGEADGVAARFTFVGGIVALGLYDALVLDSSRYSRGERFWRNVAAWHAAIAGAVIAGWIEGPRDAKAEGHELSVGVGIGADRPALILGGRF